MLASQMPPRDSDPDRVLIFDTTLRDGEQAPGCSMTLPEKLRVAHALAELGVDIIEAGFPAASQGDWESVRAVASEVRNATICGLARCTRDDIALAATALENAHHPRIHVFLATSAIHRQHKLNMAQDEILRLTVEGVRIARDLCEDVEFSPEDASRTELDFLAEVVDAAIDAGARTVNIPDTVGYAIPDEFGELFRFLRRNVRGLDRIRLSVHCHDDLGMAVANSLAAVTAGARQVECTLNGIGERAGNCSLEEIVMALTTRPAHFNVTTGVRTQRLYPTARLVSSITGMPIPRNKAVVGENAFAHEAGIHQHGMLKHRSTYEILKPEDVGLVRSQLVLGKHSGRHAFRERAAALGFELDDIALERAFSRFKALADRKKDLFDGDIEMLMLRPAGPGNGPWMLTRLTTATHGPSVSTASVRVEHVDGQVIERMAEGDGPVDAAFKAMAAAVGIAVKLRTFEIRSVSAGEDAQGEAVVCVDYEQRSYRGSSVSMNIVESSTRAFLDVLNQIALRASLANRQGRFTEEPLPAPG